MSEERFASINEVIQPDPLCKSSRVNQVDSTTFVNDYWEIRSQSLSYWGLANTNSSLPSIRPVLEPVQCSCPESSQNHHNSELEDPRAVRTCLYQLQSYWRLSFQ